MKKIILGTSILLASFASNAGLITHNGYQLDTNSNIIKDVSNNTDLEWLKWDVTLTDNSINDYLNGLGGYVNDGWELATQSQAVELYSAFFGTLDKDGNSIDSDENTKQDYAYATSSNGNLNVAQNFIELFGITGSFPAYTYSVGVLADEDQDGEHSYAIALDWGTHILPRMWWEGINENSNLLTNGRGLAFVRSSSDLSQEVPEPSTLAIFMLGIMGVASRKLKGNGRKFGA